MRMTSRTGSARRICGDFEKVSELRTGHRTRRLAFVSSWGLGLVPHVLGGTDEKARIERFCLSPVEKPLNSKIIKSFVPEQRSRYVFSNFEIPMFYLYGHSIYVSHIVISWLWYNCIFQIPLVHTREKIRKIKSLKKIQMKYYIFHYYLVCWNSINILFYRH